MPLSRPVLLALIGAILAVGAFFATSGAREDAVEPTPATPPKAAKPTPAKAKPTKPEPAKAKAAKPQPAKQKPKAAKTKGLPAPVAAAVRKGRTTMIFFRQREGADDAATARAVAAQRGRKNVAVFTASIKDLDRYRAVVVGLGITQAPAVVILGKEGKARLIEGFIDPPTLAQEVADAR